MLHSATAWGREGLSVVIFAAAVALASCAGGGPDGLSDLRVCAAEAYDEEAEECSEDQREQALTGSTVYCSAKVGGREGERFTGGVLYEGDRSVTIHRTLPEGSGTVELDFSIGSGSLPGGRWRCELAVGSEKIEASFRIAGPTGPISNLAACPTANTVPAVPVRVCREDESDKPLRSTDSVTCSATVVGQTGKVVRVDFLYEGHETGASSQREIPRAVVVVSAEIHSETEQNLPGGDYECRFALAGEEVGEKRFSIAGGGGQALGEPNPLPERVLQPGELPGFAPGATQVLRSPRAWAAASGLPQRRRAGETARLRRLGFVVGVLQFFDKGGREAQGLSEVVQLGSSRAARAELSYVYGSTKASVRPPETLVPFAVPGIPGARGFDRKSPGGGGQNIVFTDGPYLYLVGAVYGPSERAGIRNDVLAAAAALYARVRALPAP